MFPNKKWVNEPDQIDTEIVFIKDYAIRSIQIIGQ